MVVVAFAIQMRPSPSTSSVAPVASVPSSDPSLVSSAVAPVAPLPTSVPLPVRRPPASMAEFGVLTARTDDQLDEHLDRGSLTVRVTPDLCGDTAACDAVRATLRDESLTTLQVLESSIWSLEKVDVDASARGLTAAEKAGVTKLPRVVVVHVATPTGPNELALRAAIAGA